MDLNQLNFTRRTFRSEKTLYSNYIFEFNVANCAGEGLFELSKIDKNILAVNPFDDIIVPNRVPENTEVTFIPFEYPNPGNKIFIAYGPNIFGNTGTPCFTSPLKDSIRLLRQNINKDGPGSRLGITLQRSRHNIWAFGGYPGAGGTNSIPGSYFFLFNGTSDSWIDKTDLAVKANIPNLVYHTMTNINDEYLLVIGGGTYNNQGILVDKPFDKAYKFDLNKETWSTTSLINCPTNTKIGHTTTIVNGNLIVIGGTDNQEESKLNIYSDILSIDPTTLKCTNINVKHEDGTSTSIKRAFHATTYMDNYLLINSGMREPEYEYQELYIDTSTWTRKFNFKNIEQTPILNYNLSSSQSTSNTNMIVYSVVGILLFLIISGLLYYFLIFKKRKKRGSSNTQILYGQIDNQEPMVEWVRSDSKIIQLDNEAVFSLEDRATTSKNNDMDREADLHQLNSLNLIYKNPKTYKQDRLDNIQQPSETFINSTLVNNANYEEENTITPVYLPK